MKSARRLVALLCALVLLPLLAVSVGSPGAASTAAPDPLFSPLSGYRPGAAAQMRPADYRAYRADVDGIREALAGSGSRAFTVPDPAGTPTTFWVAEDPVMAPELLAAHPDVRTYAGGTEDGTSIRLDVTPFGFHAMVRRPDGVAWYVDPATHAVGEERVLSYAGAAVGAPEETFVEKELRSAADQAQPESFSTPGGVVSQRTYRLAFLTDPSYAAKVAPGATTHAVADPLVYAAKVSLINRVNEVYNDDVAYRFELIPGTDTELNLLTDVEATGANGPCGPTACFTTSQLSTCGGGTLTRNIFALGRLVGADTFDIGHIGFGKPGGGIAGLGVVGGASKARGCTGVTNPVGDLYAIDYVAHEMGHQMGGDHTFNGTEGSCGGNENSDTAVEPGSGSSIQAYAGICDSDDLQPHSDPYFSFKSIDQFEATTSEARSPLSEQQSVAFTGLDAGEQMTISCAAGCTPTTITYSGVVATDLVSISTAISTAFGSVAAATAYDGATSLPSGFTATWTATTDQPRITVAPAGGATFDAKVGVLRDGGPQTNGGTTTESGNHSPTVTVPVPKTIPRRTPFTLTGSAADTDGDTLTYLWEQTDGGSGTQLTDNDKPDGPLFRMFGTAAQVSSTDTQTYHSPGENLAGTDPSRTFPDLLQILAGNTNAETGTCPEPLAADSIPVTDPALDCFSEFLPTSGRTLHFRMTARDEFTPDAPADDPGGVTWGDVAITVDPTAGPFLVTSRDSAGSPASGFETVTWAVAGTNTAALAQNVKISLSTDGGLTYPTVLAATTPNDGSQVVTLPNISTSTARIKVEAVDNYFFDVNNANFAIEPCAASCPPVVDAGPDASVPLGTAFQREVTFNDEAPATATATVDYGDGTVDEDLEPTGNTLSLDHTYATVGQKSVTVTVEDEDGLVGTDSVTVTVNGPPTVNAGPDATATAGASYTSSGSVSDETPGTATATVDYGDGGGAQPLALTGSTFTLSHTYPTAGARTVTVKVTDAGGLSATDTATVTVSKAASATTAKAQPKKVRRGHAFKVTATVTASVPPQGVIEVYRGTKLIGTGTLTNGTVTVEITKRKAKRLKAGTNTLTATYVGSPDVAGSQVDFVVKVKRVRRD